jgi:hypothetical protein
LLDLDLPDHLACGCVPSREILPVIESDKGILNFLEGKILTAGTHPKEG